MTAYCGLCIGYAEPKAFDRYLFVSQMTEINTCILLLVLRQLDEACQPLDETAEDP